MFDCLCCNHEEERWELPPEIGSRVSQPSEKMSLRRDNQSNAVGSRVEFIPLQMTVESRASPQAVTVVQRQAQSLPLPGPPAVDERSIARTVAAKEE